MDGRQPIHVHPRTQADELGIWLESGHSRREGREAGMGMGKF